MKEVAVPEQYLTFREVADEVGLSTAVVAFLVDSGQLGAVTVDGQWRIPRVELDQYLEAGMASSTRATSSSNQTAQ